MFLHTASLSHLLFSPDNSSALRMNSAEELAGSTAPFGFFDPLGLSTVSILIDKLPTQIH